MSTYTQHRPHLLSFSGAAPAMDTGGAAGGGGAVGAGVGAEAAGGPCAAQGDIRAFVRLHIVLGLAAATFALCAQLKQQGQCAATEEEAAIIRTHGLLLLPVGAYAVAAMVTAFEPGAWRQLHSFVGWGFDILANAVSTLTYIHLGETLAAAVAAFLLSCPGHVYIHMAESVAHDGRLTVLLCFFFLIGFAALVAAIVAP